MNPYKELARIFTHYTGKPSHKLEEKDDKMMADLSALISATWTLGTQQGQEEALLRFEDSFNEMKKIAEQVTKLDYVSDFKKKTPHINREK
jgi:hypothetical protein